MTKKDKINLIILLILITILLIILFGFVILFAIKDIESSVESEKYNLSRDISENVSDSDIEINLYINTTDSKANEYQIILITNIQQGLELINLNDNQVYTEEDKYLLAKMAMAEAESQNIYTKTLIILSILNRVENDNFPDSIQDVIFESNGEVYQYSPVMPDGRWWYVEPDKECYEAVEMVLNAKYDYSDGALYFESCEGGDSWHNKNLEFLYQSEDLRFYK